MSDRSAVLDVILQAPVEDEVSSHFELGRTAPELDLTGGDFLHGGFVATPDDRQERGELVGLATPSRFTWDFGVGNASCVPGKGT